MPEQPVSQDSTVIQRILEERAAALARPPKATATGDVAELVVAMVRGEHLGIPIGCVREIQALGNTLTHVPGLPAYWAGLMSLRGRLYPVLDLGQFLNLPFPAKAGPAKSLTEGDQEPGAEGPLWVKKRGVGAGLEPGRRSEMKVTSQNSGKVVLVSAAGVDVGLLVDDVPQVRQLAPAEVGPPLTDTGGGKQPIVCGVTSDLLSVLDLEALLSDPRLVVQDEMGPSQDKVAA